MGTSKYRKYPFIEPFVDHLLEAKRVVVLTGAGVSAPSGIPTFRDTQTGYWSKYDPEELATEEAFLRNPKLVTRWYDERRLNILKSEPNHIHEGLAEIEQLVPHFTLITQNVDGLHQRAGSQNMIELHGSILRWYCRETGERFENLPTPLPNYPCKVSDISNSYLGTGEEFIEPDIILFGMMLSEDVLEAANEAVEHCDLLVSIGTSNVVYPAAGFVMKARRLGAITYEFNLEMTASSPLFNFTILGDASRTFPKVMRKLDKVLKERSK